MLPAKKQIQEIEQPRRSTSRVRVGPLIETLPPTKRARPEEAYAGRLEQVERHVQSIEKALGTVIDVLQDPKAARRPASCPEAVLETVETVRCIAG